MRKVVALASVLGGLLSMVSAVLPARVEAQIVVRTRAGEVTGPLDGLQVRTLPFAASHVAVYWAGNHDAEITVALSTDGESFDDAQPVEHDEVGEQRRNGLTYGTVMGAGGATVVALATVRSAA